MYLLIKKTDKARIPISAVYIIYKTWSGSVGIQGISESTIVSKLRNKAYEVIWVGNKLYLDGYELSEIEIGYLKNERRATIDNLTGKPLYEGGPPLPEISEKN